jgi:hypothetical protein
MASMPSKPPKILPTTLKERLRKLNIRHFDDLIHDQDKNWLIQNFSQGASEYPVNVTTLIRNIVWQARERVQNQDIPPIKELVRTFWYMYIKPVLARVNALSKKVDQYNRLVDVLVGMVKDWRVMEYKDIGFRDDNQFNRKVGVNANVILFSEKLGHYEFLKNIADIFQISIIALGGQPSMVNVEYFVDDLKSQGVDIRRSFFLFSIVDYDTSGWIVRDAFIDDLNCYGIKNITYTDLIHPDALLSDEITSARYPLKDDQTTSKKNTDWLREIKKAKYQNQIYLEPEQRGNKRVIYGLEGEAVSFKRLEETLKELLPPLLGKDDERLKIMMLTQLKENLQKLIIKQLS